MQDSSDGEERVRTGDSRVCVLEALDVVLEILDVRKVIIRQAFNILHREVERRRV